jgi:hypothetical protein
MQSVYESLGCVNAADICWDVWSAPEKYHWGTMSEWRSTMYLKDGSRVVMPARPKQLSLYMPNPFNERTMSGKNYSGLEIKLTYDDGEISGLPFVCKDQGTFTVTEAMSRKEGEGQEQKTVSYCCTQEEFDRNTCSKIKVSDLLIPDGVLLEEKDILGGESRWYTMASTLVRQVLVPTAGSGDCKNVDDGTAASSTPLVMPSSSGFGTMTMHDKPTGDDLKNLPLAVEGGTLTMNVEVEEDLPQDNLNFTGATAGH